MRSVAALLVIGALLMAPVAMAAPQPGIYYLSDSESGPLGEGKAQAEAPDENATAAARPILYGDADMPSAVFHLDDGEWEQMKGRAMAGVWIAASAAIDANLSATLYDVDADGAMTPLANASHSLLLDPDSLPDPEALLPPDPTDPEGAVFHVAAQVLPLLMEPPVLFDFGVIDQEIADGHHVALGLYMSPGSLGIPLGTVAIQYSAQESPSFVYAPWYAPDPAPVDPVAPSEPAPSDPAPSDPAPSDPASGSGDEGDDDGASGGEPSGESKKSPGVGLFATLALVGAVLVARRR